MGTSRVMQLRKEFFKEPETFVNAGGAVKTLEDIDFFIKNLPIYQTVSNKVGLDKEMVTTVPEEVLNIFTEHNSDFYDLSSLVVMRQSLWILIHGTDVMYLKIMLYMSERTDVLDKYTDSKFLRIVIQNTKQDFLSF